MANPQFPIHSFGHFSLLHTLFPCYLATTQQKWQSKQDGMGESANVCQCQWLATPQMCPMHFLFSPFLVIIRPFPLSIHSLIFGHSNSQMGPRQKKGINKQISPSSSNSDESNSFLYRKFHSLFSFPFVFLLTKVSPLFNSFRLFKKQQKMHGLRDPFSPILLG